MIQRLIYKNILSQCFIGKSIIIYGPRQVGKTTLTKAVAQYFSDKKTLFLNGDDISIHRLLVPIQQQLERLCTGYNLIIIDEAQRIADIGLVIKLLVDTIPNIQVIATGSSSFDLAAKITEPMTGRSFIYHLYPLCFNEVVGSQHPALFYETVKQQMIYGSYPVTMIHHDPEHYLLELVNTYLYQDILTLDGIKKSRVIIDILRALALQIGSECSFLEIATTVGISKDTVMRYVDILEQCFIIFSLPPLHTNQRREIKSHKKYYFWDLGIRNALIGNFNPLNSRTDTGALRENYRIAERKKLLSYTRRHDKTYFRRQTAGAELDYIEYHNGTYIAYECKLSTSKYPPLPADFAKNYPYKAYHIVNPESYYDFLQP